MTAKPIRIMRIITRLNIGGPAIHVTLLTKKLSAPDFESMLVTGSIEAKEGDMSYYARQHGIEPVIVPELVRSIHLIRDLKTLWKLYWLIRQHKPDVVHTHTAKAGFLGRWAAKLAGVPVIIHTFHGHAFEGYFSWLKTRFFIFLEQMTARISDTIITLTQGLRRALAEKYKITRKEHITVLPLGLDLDTFANIPRKHGEFRKAWNIPQNVPLIGLVGRFVPVKNHPLFVRAAKQVCERFPDARFILVGDGETRAEIEVLIEELGLKAAFTITGWIRDTPTAYSDMDVTVISSVNEGTPVTIIEALSSGCPVVATAVGGLPDLLDGGNFGTLVPSGDVDQLAQGIIAAIENPPDTTAARAAMLDRYGIDRLVKDLDGLYRGLLSKKRKS